MVEMLKTVISRLSGKMRPDQCNTLTPVALAETRHGHQDKHKT